MARQLRVSNPPGQSIKGMKEERESLGCTERRWGAGWSHLGLVESLIKICIGICQ